jgi:DNA-binding Xre family transcriptional regulator
VKRQVDYQWHLDDLAAGRRLRPTSDLRALLAERGVELSPSQVYRLVTQRPERISLKVLAALCDIFECEISDLLTVTAVEVAPRKHAVSQGVVDLNTQGRPRRARVARDDDNA